MNTLEVPESKIHDIEKFSKFDVLPNELRCHTLKYSDSQTLFNYSQCSKLCNSQIQQFNTKAPLYLLLTEEADGILVEFIGCYNNLVLDKRMGEKKVLYSENRNAMNDVVKYLEPFFKYNKEGGIETICVDMRRWPKEILKIKQIEKIERWNVTIYRSMFDDLKDFAVSNYGSLSYLTLASSEESDIIPRDFFKCEAIKNLRNLTTGECEIDEDDFLALWNLYLTCSMSFDLIRRKFIMLNEMEECRNRTVLITLPDDDERTFDLNVLFPIEQFPGGRHFGDYRFHFGHVNANIHFPGRSLYMRRDDV